jgi:FKBP-type peptidyl-prolyl cis-trans isomerase
MKKLILLGTLAIAVAACNKKEEQSKVEFANNNDKLSYSIGIDAGREIFNTIQSQNMDTVINRELMVRGLEDAIMGRETAIHPDSAKTIIRDYFMKAQESRMADELKKYEANKSEGETFLAENKSKAGITTTASGLQYEVIKEGKGKKPMLNDSALVHYTGTFLNGEKFDSSVDRGEPFSFSVNYGSVIEGWVEAVQLMTEGSKYRFWVPYELGYGDRFLPGIPPYSLLVFEIELIKVIPTK